MKILTSKNGIALVAVLTVLLVLTLLLPAMFTMTESATISSKKAQTEQQASYFARSSAEMTAMAFEEFYEAYEAAEMIPEADRTKEESDLVTNYEDYFVKKGSMKANIIYVYTNDSYKNKKPPAEVEDDSKAGYAEWQEYEANAITYRAVKAGETAPTVSGYTQYGYVDCKITYEEVLEYYKVNAKTQTMELLVPIYDANGNVTKTPKDQFNAIKREYERAPGADKDSCQKVERKQAKITAVATIEGKTYNAFSRSCIVILPTKPMENSWLSKAPTEIKGNQIFADTTNATGVFELSYNSTYTGKGSGGESVNAINQVVYAFSTSGNMVISKKGLTLPAGFKYNLEDLSLGVEPVTTTRNPEEDPHFNCIPGNNMSKWVTSVQKDNFIMFASSNGIEVDMPVNLMINPCRTGRIGDGLEPNKTLYKLLVFQAPNITFKGSVNSMISLWKKGGIWENIKDQAFGNGYDARRVTSIILSAPENTPYSYAHPQRKEIVKAGKVCFMEDAYLWVIPITENGSGYNTQTVYYKGSDIRLHKFANAGDVFYFNAEVPTQDGTSTTGFSMSAYYMDVIYPKTVGEEDHGLNIWKDIQDQAYGFAQERYAPVEYVEKDLIWIGNIYDEVGADVEQTDDIFVVWES